MAQVTRTIKLSIEQLFIMMVNQVVERLMASPDQQGNNRVADYAPTRMEFQQVKDLMRVAGADVYKAVSRYSIQFTAPYDAGTGQPRPFQSAYSFDTEDTLSGPVIKYVLQYNDITYDANLLPAVESYMRDAIVSKLVSDWFVLKGLPPEAQYFEGRQQEQLRLIKNTLEQRIIKPRRKHVDF